MKDVGGCGLCFGSRRAQQASSLRAQQSQEGMCAGLERPEVAAGEDRNQRGCELKAGEALRTGPRPELHSGPVQ